MRKLLLVLAVALVGTLSSGLAAAQAPVDELAVTIPFNFTVGERVLPAGDYDVEISRVGKTITLRPVGAPKRGNLDVVMPILTRLGTLGPNETLIFDRKGEDHKLSEVWFGIEDGFLVSGQAGDIEHAHRSVRATKKGMLKTTKG